MADLALAVKATRHSLEQLSRCACCLLSTTLRGLLVLICRHACLPLCRELAAHFAHQNCRLFADAPSIGKVTAALYRQYPAVVLGQARRLHAIAQVTFAQAVRVLEEGRFVTLTKMHPSPPLLIGFLDGLQSQRAVVPAVVALKPPGVPFFQAGRGHAVARVEAGGGAGVPRAARLVCESCPSCG